MVGTSGSGDLLDDLRAHLASRGIVRLPAVAGVLHPMFIEPKLGAVAPGENVGSAEVDQLMVLSLRWATGIAVGPYESWYEKPCVDVVIRARRARDVRPMSASLRGELEDRRAWTMSSGLFVIESGVWREPSRVGSDDRAFTTVVSFWFQIYSGRGPRDGL